MNRLSDPDATVIVVEPRNRLACFVRRYIEHQWDKAC